MDDRDATQFERLSAALYRDGRDGVAWHGDHVARPLPEALVATISVGAPRRFLLRPTGGGPSLALSLGWGDLLVMGGSCQRTYEHAVPRSHVPPRASPSCSAPQWTGHVTSLRSPHRSRPVLRSLRRQGDRDATVRQRRGLCPYARQRRGSRERRRERHATGRGLQQRRRRAPRRGARRRRERTTSRAARVESTLRFRSVIASPRPRRAGPPQRVLQAFPRAAVAGKLRALRLIAVVVGHERDVPGVGQQRAPASRKCLSPPRRSAPTLSQAASCRYRGRPWTSSKRPGS